MTLSRFTFPLSLLVLAWLFMPLSAHAYLDPASGGYVIQVAVATVLGGLFAVKTYWHAIKLRISTLFARKPQEKQES